MSNYDSSNPAPDSPDGKALRERCRAAGKPDPYGAFYDTPDDVIEDVDHILGALPGKVFYAADGEALILTDEGKYIISVQPGDKESGFNGGHPTTSSAYLVTLPAADVAAAMDADEGDIAGWTGGWEC